MLILPGPIVPPYDTPGQTPSCIARSSPGLARASGWEVHLYDAKAVVDEAVSMLAERADEVLQGPRATMGPPWTKDHRIALAATIVAG